MGEALKKKKEKKNILLLDSFENDPNKFKTKII